MSDEQVTLGEIPIPPYHTLDKCKHCHYLHDEGRDGYVCTYPYFNYQKDRLYEAGNITSCKAEHEFDEGYRNIMRQIDNVVNLPNKGWK